MLRLKIIKQPIVGTKMVAVHFTTMPCEPNTVYKAQRKPNFYNMLQKDESFKLGQVSLTKV